MMCTVAPNQGLLSALIVAASLLLTACAEQRLRDQAQVSLRAGNYEQALGSLEHGLKRYPESPRLRSGVVQARTEAMTRLLTEAAAARAAGRLDDAVELLERAKAFDPGQKRTGELLAEVQLERRQLAALSEAEALVSQRKPDAALRVLSNALKDNPRNRDLLALQRRLELDRRQAQLRASQLGLSETRPISLDFRDASLRTVLDVVSRNSGVNFVFDKDIRSDTRVTVYLRSAKVEEAIDLIVSTYGLAKKVIDAQTILIYPNTPEKQREHQEQVVKVLYLANAEAKGAAAFLKSMLKIRDPYVDERSNMIALRDTPENIEMVERLVALYDTDEPEVLLELEVIEVNSNRLTELGIQFPDTFSLSVLPPGGDSGLTLANVRGLTRDRIGLSVGSVLVNLKRSVGDVNTLASPRIRVKNKEKAKVMVGDKVPLVTATTGTGGFVSDSVSYIDVGMKLEVEPTIYSDDEVAIKVALEVSSLGTQTKTNSGTLAYQIGTRNASTLLRLRDGQTQLLGGLISTDERTSASRVPGLGDVPVVGRLFSNQSDTSQRTELVLAVTPHVLRNVRQLDASASELWVGTDASPRLRPVGGRIAVATEASDEGKDQAAPSSAANPPVVAVAPRPVPPSGPASAPVVQWQAPTEAIAGDTFNATVLVQADSPLRGVSFQIAYSQDRVAVVSAEEGDFFRKKGGRTSFTHAVADGDKPGEGRVKGGLLRSDDGAATGQGTLIKLWLKALKSGPLDLTVLNLESISAGAPLPRAVLPPSARVTIK